MAFKRLKTSIIFDVKTYDGEASFVEFWFFQNQVIMNGSEQSIKMY